MVRTDIEFEGWPSGTYRWIIAAPVEPAELAKKYGAKLIQERDDLGDYTAILVHVDNVGPVLVERRDTNVTNCAGFVVDLRAEENQAFDKLIEAFSLKKSDAEFIEWNWELQDDNTFVQKGSEII